MLNAESEPCYRSLHKKARALTERIFNEIMENSDQKLHSLLPVCNSCPKSVLRRTRLFSMPVCKTNGLQRSFIMFNAMNTALYHT